MVKLAQFSTGGVAHYCIGGNRISKRSMRDILKDAKKNMPIKYKLSDLASQDIDSIIDYTVQNFGYKAMIKFYQSLEHCIETPAENLLLGLPSDFIKEKYYRFNHQSHVVYFQILSSEILIIRILHKSVDVERWFD